MPVTAVICVNTGIPYCEYPAAPKLPIGLALLERNSNVVASEGEDEGGGEGQTAVAPQPGSQPTVNKERDRRQSEH